MVQALNPGPLLRVAYDPTHYLVRRTGRFDIERDAVDTGKGMERAMKHLADEIKRMTNRMVEDCAKRGLELKAEYKAKIGGPFPHMDFDTDTASDSGPNASIPDYRDRDGWLRYEQAEKRRTAKKYGERQELVDYTIELVFERVYHGIATVPCSVI